MNDLTTFELLTCGAAAGFLLLFNAILVATEFGLMMLRFTRFESEAMTEAKRSKGIAALLGNVGESTRRLKLGMTICSIGLGFLLAPLALRYAPLGGDSGGSWSWALLLGYLVALAAHFVLGEMVPRVLALHHPVDSLKVTVPLAGFFRAISAPLAWPLLGLSRLILTILRLDPKPDFEQLAVESQIRSIVEEGNELAPMAESIVSNALGLSKRVAHDIMIPRNQLRYIDLEDSNEECLQIARKTGHTRFPVCKGDLDNCVGILHIKDVFRKARDVNNIDWQGLMRPMLRFQMDESLERVLQGFLKQRKHFALLTDEFGGTVGAVTMEDVLEELVGDIQDEFDREEALIHEVGEKEFLVDGLTPLHDLAEMLGIELNHGEVSTFGGYITYELGRMPRPDETFRIGPLEISNTRVDERRVLSGAVRVVGLKPPVEEGEQAPEQPKA